MLSLICIAFANASWAQPTAAFTATPLSGCPPMVVSFTDNSTGSPVAWKWDLGNGTISYLQNPVATYFNPGTYTVKLLVRNAAGDEDSIAKSQYVTVYALPDAKFTASDTVGCFPLKVQFTDNSLAGSGNIVSWQWDFGDGTLSTLQNPQHTYTNSGNYTVILRVVNSNGCSKVLNKSTYIKISNGVRADFTYSSSAGCSTPAPVAFTNTTVGTGTINYTWSFGDAGTSTSVSPTHNYMSGGVYTVSLIASNSFGCRDTIVKPNAINVGFVDANFTMPATACQDANVSFTNTSNPSSFVGAYWSFSDGTTSNSINPVKAFATAGTFQVKLVTDFGSCIDSIVKSITINPKPVAAFTASNNTGCAAPLTVSLQAATTASSYSWTFGDGGTSTLQNPTHTYNASGSYSVKLIVTSASGCTDTLVKNNFVQIAPPQIASIDSVPLKGCLPFTFTPKVVMVDSIVPSTYLWNFGDGNTSTSATPSHTYTVEGNYDVTVIVSTGPGCYDTLKAVQGIKVGTRPTVHFTAMPTDVCANTSVQFTDQTTNGPVTEWFWQFGDGGTSADPNPSHMYNDTGWFNVMLVATNYGCSDTLKIDSMVHIKPPIAKFDTAFLCNDPLKRRFIDKSIGATSWAWDFGDGGTSALQQPSHVYAGTGTYNVSLTVSNGTCTHTTKKPVRVIKHSPVLTITDTVGCLNKRVTADVINVADSNVSKYTWYFAQMPLSPISTTNHPVGANYTTAGTKHPAVVVQNKLNCRDTAYTAVPVKIYGAKANFGSLLQSTCFGNTIHFTDSTKTDSIHPVAQWIWNFGEGSPQTFTAAPFSHNYATAGTYNVMLTVIDTYGCKDSITRPAFISITKPVASFLASDTMICPGIPVTFTNTSQAENGVYAWNFGDGDTSTATSPTHTFASPGAYTVKLVITDKNGCHDSASVVVRMFSAHADFTISDSFSTCPPLVVNTTNLSSNYISLNWVFGDGGNSQLATPSHIYTAPGNYTIKLIVTNNGGCVDSMTKNIVVKGPSGVFSYLPTQICKPGTVHYSLVSTNTVKYIWDFADGTTVFSTTDTISHVYTSAGMFCPKIILEDSAGCRVAVAGPDTVRVYGVNAHITSSVTMLCDSGHVAFTDSSTSNDIITGYQWNFGDGGVSTLHNPGHYYTDTGAYTVTLVTTTQTGCTDTAFLQNSIAIASAPAVTIAGDTSACAPANMKFTGQLATADTSTYTWNWTFGNGNTSALQSPDSQHYANAGTYTVNVTASNGTGCTGHATRQVIIHPNPVVSAGADTTACRNVAFNLHATGAATYVWDANPSLSCTNCASPVALPTSDITYMVTGTSAYGCIGRDTVAVRIKQPFTMHVGRGDTVCHGTPVTLSASGADLYQWSPSRWLSNANLASPVSVADSTITYAVIGRDLAGCFRDTGRVTVKVYPQPTIQILNGDNVLLEVGKNLAITCTHSPDVTKCTWEPAQWLSCSVCPDPVTAPKEDVTYTVTATNAGNCVATDKITINLVCGKANVYMPNTFSPNGDGMNDVYYPRGVGLYNIRSLRIYNRWGQAVFERYNMSANDPSQGWNGTFNGNKLQPDVYVYIMEVMCANNVVFPFKGNITLVR